MTNQIQEQLNELIDKFIECRRELASLDMQRKELSDDIKQLKDRTEHIELLIKEKRMLLKGE
jgi:chromosome segregation ATPase